MAMSETLTRRAERLTRKKLYRKKRKMSAVMPFYTAEKAGKTGRSRDFAIADPADCEVCSVTRFLNAKNVKPAEIHRQLVEIYGENLMTDGMVRKWVRQFNDVRTNVRWR
ncbi:hypothetical protein AVEN_152926-1 [Araneus ventricosus]|uniref:Mos1 transposase HTH domain-containing protein n=1 Tax=Araneus ventricosus TaxID=182803 RepID=A0A4Y2ADP7_ARAVE|nr:hypothetical protein AVEN_152926-1 [Araneus ventricosus]